MVPRDYIAAVQGNLFLGYADEMSNNRIQRRLVLNWEKVLTD